MRRILALIGSIRFFVFVSIALGAVVLGATVVPQGLPDTVYQQQMDPVAWTLVRVAGLHRIGSSPLLLGLIVLVEVSLLTCTVPRLVRRLRHRKGDRHRPTVGLAAFAPDIIHAGLAIVIAGGFLQFAFGAEWEYDGPVGGELAVDGTSVRVRSAGESYTNEGVLAGWYIDAIVNGEDVRFASNAPAATAVGRLHFRNYAERGHVTLAANDRELELQVGEGLARTTGGAIILLATDGTSATFADVPQIPDDPAGVSAAIRDAPRLTVQAGETLDSLTIADVRSRTWVGFTVTRNPGRIPVLVGLLLLGSGMAIYVVTRVRRRL